MDGNKLPLGAARVATRGAAKRLAVHETTNLTEVEVSGLKTTFTFADGHAYHDMPSELQPVMNDLQRIWADARTTPVPRMEERFKRIFGRIVRSPTLEEHTCYSLCPTASNSIDIVAAWLKSSGYSVGLLEPAFDNLFLLLKRRQVNVISVQESDLLDLGALAAKIKYANLKALMVVSPNNPTGFQLTAQEFRALCEQCRELGVTLVLDTTFRFYSRAGYDEYRILEETGLPYVVVEDTGKTWPTQDMKVSLMAYSKALAPQIRPLYEELYLCHSNFSVALLGQLIEQTDGAGLDKVVWKAVDERRAKLERVLDGTLLRPVQTERSSCALPVAWLDCSATGLSDLELVRRLEKHDVALLPGRFFFWNSQQQNTDKVRVSLLRADGMFDRGLSALQQALLRVTRGGPRRRSERPKPW